MRIEVTQEDIERGIPCSPVCCPVARALARTTGKPSSVESEVICVGGRRFETPDSVIDFVLDFDDEDDEREVELKPFSFDLPI